MGGTCCDPGKLFLRAPHESFKKIQLPYARLAEAADADVRKYAGVRGAALEKLKAQGFDLAPYNSALARFRGLRRDSAMPPRRR